MDPKGRRPNAFVATLPILFTMAFLIWLVVLNDGAPHIAIVLGIAITAIIGRCYGYTWVEMREHMVQAGVVTLPVIGILMTIGMLIGSWIVSGTVPILMRYGFDFLNPSLFLPSVAIIASVISLATGTSWGTIGTIGLAFMGIGEGLGVPAPYTAGAVVSGAYFGDKVSPLSDSTNFCANITGVDLYQHIKGMLPSTIPAMLIGLVIYYFIGRNYVSEAFVSASIEEVSTVLQATFTFHPVLLIPPLVIIIAALLRCPPIPSIFAGLAAGVFFAFVIQGATVSTLLECVMYGYTADTGVEFVDKLLSKGGLDSMMWVSGLILLTVCYGGLLEKIRTIEVLVEAIVYVVRSMGLAVLTNTVIMIVLTFTTDLYVAYTLAARVFCPIKRGWGYSTINVSRVLESSGTMIDPLVPWSPAGVFVTGHLGVPTLVYAPLSFVCWLTPLFDILWGFSGFFMPKATDEEFERWVGENRKIAKDGKLVPIRHD